MRYISTRGHAPALNFNDVLLSGLAPDGGLYVPAQWPTLSADTLRGMQRLRYAELAVEVLRRFTGDAIPGDDLSKLVERAYSRFDHTAVAPLRQLSVNLWLLELFHGPTLAFKDIAMQLLGELFGYALKRRGEWITIIGATSGDTGAAAIEAFRDQAAVQVFILHPHERVSEIQRRQMTTVLAPNIHNIAIRGTFDDCQALVKAMFADRRLDEELHLSAVNSINWVRVAAQCVYYFHAALALGAPDRSIAFSVPTGNFGNVYAGNVARRMGLPLARLTIASNRNDILTRFHRTGTMRVGKVVPTLSPSMDIQVSSNFERLLYELLDRDGDQVAAMMNSFRTDGEFGVDAEPWERFRSQFDAHRFDDRETVACIADLFRRTGACLDPHSAVGVAAVHGFESAPRWPTVCLATAHPGKFPEALETLPENAVVLPPRLAELRHREERLEILPNDLSAVNSFVAAMARP